MNKKDKRGVVVRNKERLVAQGHRKEEGIDYDEVFDPVARIESIRIFLAFASYMGFIVYQMDMKSAFLYGTIDEEVYVTQPPGFVDPKFPNKVKQKEDGIFISQDKYVAKILKKFDFLSVKTASTPIKTQKTLVKDEEAVDVDVHLYRSMIGSLMYLTASRHDIMFVVCVWYPNISSFNLEAYSDSDYAGINLDRKSITGATLVKGRLLEVTTTRHKLLLPSIELQEVKLDLKSFCWDRGSLCVGFHTTPQMVINSPCLTHIKNWLVQEQTALGKDFSNLFMADNLPKVDVIRKALRLDNADGVECLPNEEIFTKLVRMGYEKTPPKLMFYKAFFSAQ
nr:copia protein [Tanacetum cinerariifolium]